MNVGEINPGTRETLPRYALTTIVLTLVTIYVVITLQPYSSIHKEKATFGERAVWPILLLRRLTRARKVPVKDGSGSVEVANEKV